MGTSIPTSARRRLQLPHTPHTLTKSVLRSGALGAQFAPVSVTASQQPTPQSNCHNCRHHNPLNSIKKPILLAALVKGRSVSPAANRMPRTSSGNSGNSCMSKIFSVISFGKMREPLPIESGCLSPHVSSVGDIQVVRKKKRLSGDSRKVLLGVRPKLCDVPRADVDGNGAEILRAALLQGVQKYCVLACGPVARLVLGDLVFKRPFSYSLSLLRRRSTSARANSRSASRCGGFRQRRRRRRHTRTVAGRRLLVEERVNCVIELCAEVCDLSTERRG